MINNFDEILLELSYRTETGVVDLTQDSQVNILIDILKENGVENPESLAQKARVYFSYLNEASMLEKGKNPAKAIKAVGSRGGAKARPSKPAMKPATQSKAKKPQTGAASKANSLAKDAQSKGVMHLGKGYYGKSKGAPATYKKDDSGTRLVKIKPGEGPQYKGTQPAQQKGKTVQPTGGGKQPAPAVKQQAPKPNISPAGFKSDAEKRIAANKAKEKFAKGGSKGTPQQKQEIDKINIEAGQTRAKFYEKGYYKSESEEEAGSAPGNAGSMLNENGSCDVCEFALENNTFDLATAVKHLRKSLGNGALLHAEDKTGIAGQKDRVPSISAGELKQFRAATKGMYNDLHDGQLSRLMIAATAGLLKAKDIKQGIANQGWKEEDTTVSGFFGDRDGKRQQLDMAKAANRIFAPSGQEIPKAEALKLIAAGGGGANPSDTSQFAYNAKTGDLMIKFTSDKDSFGAIVAQSSFAKEGDNKKNQLDEMVKKGQISAKNAEVLKKTIDKYTKKLNGIEEELKYVVAAPAKKMLSKPPKELLKLALEFNKSDSGKKRLAGVVKKYGQGADGIKNLLKAAVSAPEELSAGDRRIVDDLKKHYGLDYLVAQNIDNIRKRSIAVERNLLNEMNKVPIKLGNGKKAGLGNYLDATNFVDKFHMAGALGDKHGVFAYGGLFDVVCGKGKITNDIIASCIGTKNQDDFIYKFGSEKEEFQLSKENQITGSVRIAYFLNDKGQKVRLGEKRQRSKTGATGRFNTVYKWDNDTIGCFQRKNGLK